MAKSEIELEHQINMKASDQLSINDDGQVVVRFLMPDMPQWDLRNGNLVDLSTGEVNVVIKGFVKLTQMTEPPLFSYDLNVFVDAQTILGWIAESVAEELAAIETSAGGDIEYLESVTTYRSEREVTQQFLYKRQDFSKPLENIEFVDVETEHDPEIALSGSSETAVTQKNQQIEDQVLAQLDGGGAAFLSGGELQDQDEVVLQGRVEFRNDQNSKTSLNQETSTPLVQIESSSLESTISNKQDDQNQPTSPQNTQSVLDNDLGNAVDQDTDPASSEIADNASESQEVEAQRTTVNQAARSQAGTDNTASVDVAPVQEEAVENVAEDDGVIPATEEAHEQTAAPEDPVEETVEEASTTPKPEEAVEDVAKDGGVTPAPAEANEQAVASKETVVTISDLVIGGSFRSTLGVFVKDADGAPQSGQVVFADVRSQSDDVTVETMLGDVEQSDIGYFLIPNGGRLNQNLEDGAKIEFAQNEDGHHVAHLINGDGSLTPLEGANVPVLFSGDDASINPDESLHTRVEDGIVGFEDIPEGHSWYDSDFDDVMFSPSIVIRNTEGDENTVSSNPITEETADQDVAQAGTSGDDTPLAGDGANSIVVGDGSDFVSSGNDNDNDNDYIETGVGDDTVEADAGDDNISGENGADVPASNTGNDILVGGGGSDIIWGGAGDDSIDGGDDNDTIYGEDGADVIEGDAGDDMLYGGDGNDRLGGGAGQDNLKGGDGSDIFVLRNEDGQVDVILDFNEQNGDVLDLSALVSMDGHDALSSILGSDTDAHGNTTLSIKHDDGTSTDFAVLNGVGELDVDELMNNGNIVVDG